VSLAGLLDLVFPRTCAGCGGRISGESRALCWDCLSETMVIRPPFCARCGDPVEGRIDHEYECYFCHAYPRGFDRARSAARYDKAIRTALQDFKYHEALWLRGDLADILLACYHTEFAAEEFDLVTYVPLHASKRRRRGYNQAELLAHELSKCIKKPLLRGCLMRLSAGASQTRLTAHARLTNVRGAFVARWPEWLEGRRVLLVDDVMTTGATVSECSRALKLAGATSVQVITVARG